VANTSYSYWHPDGDYCAFSTNSIHQSFFVGTGQRIEVYDTFSNVLVLDTRTNELVLCPLLQTDDWETYPAFSADGKTLYYCTARPRRVPAEWDQVRYSLCRISFDAKTGTYGNYVDTLLNARELNRSFTYPRPSYDGKWLLFTKFKYGQFAIWHKEADLWMMNLATTETFPLERANCDYDADSYHSWSQNSEWIAFESRRDDGLYTRAYIAHINENGRADKAFMIPQRSPEDNRRLMYSYNVPEFATKEFKVDKGTLEGKLKSGEKMQFGY
jgi:Tol biopolymer transport system component